MNSSTRKRCRDDVLGGSNGSLVNTANGGNIIGNAGGFAIANRMKAPKVRDRCKGKSEYDSRKNKAKRDKPKRDPNAPLGVYVYGPYSLDQNEMHPKL